MTEHTAARIAGLIIAAATAAGSTGFAVGATSGTSAGGAPGPAALSLGNNTPWG
jgi:hypothetical protein